MRDSAIHGIDPSLLYFLFTGMWVLSNSGTNTAKISHTWPSALITVAQGASVKSVCFGVWKIPAQHLQGVTLVESLPSQPWFPLVQIEIILLFTHTLKIIENDALTVLISVLGP